MNLLPISGAELPIMVRLKTIDEIKEIYFVHRKEYEGLFLTGCSHFISNRMLKRSIWGTWVKIIKISKWTKENKVFNIEECENCGFPAEWFSWDFIDSDEFQV